MCGSVRKIRRPEEEFARDEVHEVLARRILFALEIDAVKLCASLETGEDWRVYF